jgi:DNA-directed RNA polymerase specialized sigma24 family protein
MDFFRFSGAAAVFCLRRRFEVKIYKGYGTPVEVSDELYKELLALDRMEFNNNRKQNRTDRKYITQPPISYEKLLSEGIEISDGRNYDTEAEQSVDARTALTYLSERQNKLIYSVSEGYSYTEIAKAEGISDVAVRNAFNRAVKTFKKYF